MNLIERLRRWVNRPRFYDLDSTPGCYLLNREAPEVYCMTTTFMGLRAGDTLKAEDRFEVVALEPMTHYDILLAVLKPVSELKQGALTEQRPGANAKVLGEISA